MSRSLLALLGFALALPACHPAPVPPQPSTTAAAPGPAADFAATSQRLLDAKLLANPAYGVGLGLHEYDGKLPDVSIQGIERDIQSLKAAIAELEAFDPASLNRLQQTERIALLTDLGGALFELEVREAHRGNPMFYLGALDLTPYISRDYAPLPQRVRAVISIANGTTAHLAAGMKNLRPALPRTFVQTALMQARGTSTFVRIDVTKATAGVADEALNRELTDALGRMAKAIDGYAEFLEDALPKATNEFALGSEAFGQMLSQTQGVDIDLGQLEKALRADLARNTAAMIATAKQIDPKRTTAQVVARVTADKPDPAKVLSTASAQVAEMRAFLAANPIVTVPTDDIAEVVETPPFMRWNTAFLSSAGVFEEKSLPSFYYISPPDPNWPAAKQREYVPGKTDLLFITIHEVWPGHFLHSLHLKGNPSRVLKSTWNYTTSEGWAHYTEEMMWEAGVSDDPAIHVGQLQNALLRNVRAVSAIGLHTQGMTVEQSKELFVEQAFQDEANAEQQAVRGTFDPMYLAYTTGKLAILKLKADVMAARGEGYSAKEFHDELLSYAAAPLSAIRAGMLPGDSGPVL